MGDTEQLKDKKALTVFNASTKSDKKHKKESRKRMRRGEAGGEYLGPWAPPIKSAAEEFEKQAELEAMKEKWKKEHPLGPPRKRKRLNKTATTEDALPEKEDGEGDDEKKDALEEWKKKKKAQVEEQKGIESSEFHGKDLYDYQGRTYMYCPVEKRRSSDWNTRKYYIPRKCIHTYLGHKKGVNAIQWIPRTGHLLLSCSNDTTVKLWDAYNSKKCLRTFEGHRAGVRNICFSKQGDKFLSTSFDRWLKLWDTETGKVIWRGTSGKVPFDGTLYPENENEFLCGQKNKIAVQWDIRANRIVQKYDEHLSSVNSVTFIDGNRRFVSTSDDKKIFIWDYGVPVVIKHIAEAHLHSVPYVTVHPSQKWFIGQSMNNQIIVYSAMGKFFPNTKKLYKGHLSAGYACQVDISPDGHFVMSGDAQGRLFFWDWKNCKIYGNLKAHEQVTMGCIWHPVNSSRVATCSWDGSIKVWD